MTESLCLLAPPDRFSRSLFLILRQSRHFSRVFYARAQEDIPLCDAVFFDMDAFPAAGNFPRGARRLGYSLRAGSDVAFPVLPRPFTDDELMDFLTRNSVFCAPSFPDSEGIVWVAGEAVRLTPTEATLYTILWNADGAPVPREELAAQLFPQAQKAADSVSVYIHYLREKLEKGNCRVIFSHRGGGYSLRRTSL